MKALFMSVAMLALALSATSKADAACTFSAHFPVVCQSASNAAAVYRMYGTDVLTLSKSYTQAILAQHQCGIIYGKDTGRHKTIELIRHERIPLQNGWANVSWILVDHGPAYQIADEYLTGKCNKATPITSTYIQPKD